MTLEGLQSPTQPRYDFTPSVESHYPAVYDWTREKWAQNSMDWWTHTTLIAALPQTVPDKRVSLRVRLGSGPFHTQAIVPVDQASILLIDGSPISLKETVEIDGYVQFDIVYDWSVHDVRILAVTHAGRVYRNAGNAGGSYGPANDSDYPGFSRNVLKLAEVPLKEVAYLVVQSRRLYWAEFRNVPIQPGMPDTLEIVTSPIPKRIVTSLPLATHVYDVSIFVSELTDHHRRNALLDLVTIIEALTPDSWSSNNGYGTILPSDTSLTITTTLDIHAQIAHTLARIKQTR